MDENVVLCKACSRIDFEYALDHKISGRIRLGTWQSIVESQSCRFCRLVVRSITSNSQNGLPGLREDIFLTNELSWKLGIEASPYDQLRSEAYSNKFDLRSIARKCRLHTYRLVVQASKNRNVEYYIQYLASSNDETLENQFLGREFDFRGVDLDQVRSWMDRCELHHQGICECDGIAGRSLPTNLRLIDVHERRLVRPSSSDCVRYLTLSYVWGTEDMKRLTGLNPVVTNRADLRYEGDFENTHLPKDIPQTITDAMWLTKELGYDYLWVDALCIIQDDPIERKWQHLECMDAVYNCSDLTIVAASSLHARTGLPGISTPRRQRQHCERIGSLRMASMGPSFSELENSRSLIWNTRGWTFQEKILSKRILLFTDYQLYFRCSESVWTEEIFMETGEPSKSIETREAKYRWAADQNFHVPSKKLYFVKMFVPWLNIDDEWNYLGRFPDYAAAIREYSQRELTDSKDILIAIDGVLRTLRLDEGKFVAGLPEAHLLQSLLWHPEAYSRQERVNGSQPSWSWAGWKIENGVTYDVLDVRFLRVVILTIRNFFMACGKALGKLFDGSSSSSSSGSSSSDTSSSDTSSYTSPSSSSSSGGPMVPPMFPPVKRDWTTLKAMRKATVNVAACFGLPLMFQHHTVTSAYLYQNRKATRLRCEKPLSFATFTKDEVTLDNNKSETSTQKTKQFHDEVALDFKRPVLSLKTTIVRFQIGKSLSKRPLEDDSQSGIFELLKDGKCVGEVWTTLGSVRRAKNNQVEFLTISWGLSFQAAEIHESWVPKWTMDAIILPDSKTNMLLKGCKIVQEFVSWNSGKHLAGHYGRRKSTSVLEEQPSVMSFFDALLQAKKGKPRPRFLWSTVNVLMIERGEGDRIATRAGVGRVIFDAWLLNSSFEARDVLLG